MLIKLNDYKRIYYIINSVIKSEGVNPAHACAYFSAFGALILTRHYKLNAFPRAGLAAYHLGGDNKILVFAEQGPEGVKAGDDGFHCWIEVDGWAIDFMAPAWSALHSDHLDIPSKMFQKRLSNMSPTINDMCRAGDFYYSSTDESTMEFMAHMNDKPIYADLAEICANWFSKYPKHISASVAIGGKKGGQQVVKLSGKKTVGKW